MLAWPQRVVVPLGLMGEYRLSQVTMLDEEFGSAGKMGNDDSREDRLPWEHHVGWGESCELVGTEAGFWDKGAK